MIVVSGISLPFTEPPDAAVERAKKLAGSPVLSAGLFKRAVDARHKSDIRFVYSVALTVEAGEHETAARIPNAKVIPDAGGDMAFPVKQGGTSRPRPVVAGFGPAGMFAALCLARSGFRPIVLERGAPVEARVKDVQFFFNTGNLNTESNVQFGEGGAGTFSDGKLTTRTHDKRARYVLNELVRHGAPREILLEAKPHIGTDLLRNIVRSIRREIITLGGEVRFHTRLDDITTASGRLTAVKTADGEIEAPVLILAPGHSARDTFETLSRQGVTLSPKPFSVGVRIEHLQSEVDKALYGDFAGHPLLPRAEYRHSLRRGGRAVYTFCMCPGGTVVAAASENGGVVTNGMSSYARDLANANSALVVSVDGKDFETDALAGVQFQRGLEQAAYLQGGGAYRAPVQDAGSFLGRKAGFVVGRVKPSYTPCINASNFDKILPPQVTELLREGLFAFERKQRGFAARDSVLTGVETRTSSPVRITRGDNCEATGINGLYPCGEGAGYAGGIMSAAVDGIRVAEAVMNAIE